MATDGRYVTVDRFKKWTRDTTLTDDNLISDSILAAQQTVDTDLGRRFEEASGEPAARVYAAERGDTSLSIHDCVSISSITEDGTTVPTTDWQAEPLNNLSAAGQTVPFTRVERLTGSWHARNGKATISVTADWGWEEIPADIVVLCMIVAQTMAQHRDMRLGLAAITADGLGVSARDVRMVRDAQSRYSRRQVLFAV